MIPLIIQDQFYTIQNLQRSPILQTSNWSGTFFAVSYCKRLYYQIYFTGCKIGKTMFYIVYFFFNVLGWWGKNISYLKEPIVIDQIQNYVQEVFSYNLS